MGRGVVNLQVAIAFSTAIHLMVYPWLYVLLWRAGSGTEEAWAVWPAFCTLTGIGFFTWLAMIRRFKETFDEAEEKERKK
jgi:hypothetical protein